MVQRLHLQNYVEQITCRNKVRAVKATFSFPPFAIHVLIEYFHSQGLRVKEGCNAALRRDAFSIPCHGLFLLWSGYLREGKTSNVSGMHHPIKQQDV